MSPTNPPFSAAVATGLHELGIASFVEDGRDLRFDDPTTEAGLARRGTVIVPLIDRASIIAEGVDAAAFLQGQLGNDVAALAVGQAQLTSYSNPKGRVLALGTLHRLQADRYAFEIDASLAADTFRRLRMYVMRSRLVLTLDHSIALGLAGDDAAAMLARAGMPVPERVWDGAIADGVRVLRRPGAVPRFSLQGPVAILARRWADGSRTATPVGTAAWRLLDIDAGLPSVVAATRERFVPQMLNLDAIGGVSFTKGCYPGQEIVARLHYLGTAKRRMFRASVAGAPPLPGAALVRREHPADAADAGTVGEVVDAAPDGEGGSALLLVMQLAHAGDALRLVDDGRPLDGLQALVTA